MKTIKKEVSFVTLLILLLATIYTYSVIFSTNIVLLNKHLIATLLLFVSSVSYFKNRQIGEGITVITLLLATFGLCAFLPNIFSISIVGLKFQVFPLIVLIIHIIIIFNKYSDD